MNYKISSSNFEQPLLKPLLEQLDNYFQSIQTQFYIIGATARDMILDAHGEKSGRATRDIDIAVAIPHWEKYKQIEEGLLNIVGITKDPAQAQRFIYQGIYHLDIVPFGEIMKEDDKIFWPPDEQMAMSVLGFTEVGSNVHVVEIDQSLKLNIASLAGIFILKIVAWSERHLSTNKDADDMGFILQNYYTINEDRIVAEHPDLFDDPDFDMTTAAAHLMGRDMAQILNDSPETKQKIIDILLYEVVKKEESKLLNQIYETNKSIKFELIEQYLQIVIDELSINIVS
jgi:predicted nucleotidyltransferase